MKPNIAFVLLAAVVRVAVASEITDAVARLPSCAVPCVEDNLTRYSNCSRDDAICHCADQPLAEHLLSCVQQSCSVINMLASVRVYKETCHYPVAEIPTSVLTAFWILGALAFACVPLRLLSRVWIVPHPEEGPRVSLRRTLTRHHLGLDDLLMAVALPLLFANFYIELELLCRRDGLGRDVWTLSPKQLRDAGLWFVVGGLIYYLTGMLVKLSIICFLLRVFAVRGGGDQPTCLGPLRLGFRHALLGTLLLHVLFFGVVAGVFLGMCRPLSFYWNGWDGEHEGTCLDFHSFATSTAIVNFLIDLWMLYLPLSQILGMNLTLLRKIGIMAVLGFGVCSTIVSILRLTTYHKFANSLNMTKDNFDTTIWSLIELWSASICANLPALRILFARTIPWAVTHLYRRKFGARPRSWPRPGNGTANSRNGMLQNASTSTSDGTLECGVKNETSDANKELAV